MISVDDKSNEAPSSTPQASVWGLTPTELHDRFWASRGIQVVRLGEPSEIVEGAELFLLTASRSLVMFKLLLLVERLSWDRPDVLFVRLHEERNLGYSERVITDRQGRFARFERLYGASDSRLARVALTKDPEIARAWQTAGTLKEGWARLRRSVSRSFRSTASINGRVYDRSNDEDLVAFVRNLVHTWKRPDATVKRAHRATGQAWADAESQVESSAQFVGPVWVGAGRHVSADASVVGPAVLWDEPSKKPAIEKLQWDEIEPTEAPWLKPVQTKQISGISRASKRLFDIAFASAALMATCFIYPPVMLAIWIEDGRPFFFGHERETIGGREFKCWKFRSMRKDAEGIKAELMKQNMADGPQFFIRNDPRLTRVGRFIRLTNIDELPQFWNVFVGDMGVVGPRPSPRKENQYCPPWREARLSVRPGITGLWQVKRTRLPGLDFQEWIKYDIEYVENQSWALDIKIIYQTIVTVLRGIIRS
ncbi:MAG TPA: sugar transferase [Tepidisphaeraceae bacterium]|jgi:lipopolysaccharide/colanic/teichoic acid biosynthesis glycosyltransferase|nr:sugar transferase [Tepidisphaeraceae bacterium]